VSPADDPRVGRLWAQVEEAARVVPALWPLATAIAVNPLWDLRQLPFEAAVATAGPVLGIEGYPAPAQMAEAYAEGRISADDLRAALAAREGRRPEAGPGGEDVMGSGVPGSATTAVERLDARCGSGLAGLVDREVAKWCGAYVAGILADPDEEGFYRSWRRAVVHDPGARALVGRAGRHQLAAFGEDPASALRGALDHLAVPEARWVAELARHLGRMPGWAGLAKWRSLWAEADSPGRAPTLLDYLAVRLCYEAVVVTAPAPPPRRARLARRGIERRHRSSAPGGSRDGLPGGGSWWTASPALGDLPEDLQRQLAELDPPARAATWLAAFEIHYRDRLLRALDAAEQRWEHPAAPSPAAPSPVAQAVFCIDVRSERLRRHLEAEGPYETFGAAGFFGVPLRYQPFGAAETVDLCPVLVRPRIELGEQPVGAAAEEAARRSLAGRQAMAGARRAFDGARKGSAAQFVLAEAGGFVAGPLALAKTLAPRGAAAARGRLHALLAPPVPTAVTVDPPEGTPLGEQADEEQALLAEATLRTMGLVRAFAPLVLLCGHGSSTENNPYASALDCGACGGNRGGHSARATAAILNRPAIRRRLAERGIEIPVGTLFVAGEHDTATDRVSILDRHLVPASHRDQVAALQAALDRAGAATAAERRRTLPGSGHLGRIGQPEHRAADWAQVQPEWGLAGNAAFVIGPRRLTAGVHLEGRCFLHSYDPAADPDGQALESILTAPVVVAHWINAQYYFSTVEPAVFSSGDKTAQNVVGGIGVVRGAGGDLGVGLPLQSLFDGPRPFHEPLRLLVVVQAPLARLEAIIGRNRVLQELFDGEWLHLVAQEDEGSPWQVRLPGGTWARWAPADAPVRRPVPVG
jgi:uncharacterized protein YbcC (UPF0753/DUF2309 family)